MNKIKPNLDSLLYKIDNVQKYKSSLLNQVGKSDVSFEKIQKEFDVFERINLDNLEIKNEIEEMFPGWLLNQAHPNDLALFLSMSRYDKRKRTFIVGCYNSLSTHFQLMSYKWRQVGNIKWKTRAGTHPNKSLLVRIYTDSDPIYVVEGQKDSLCAILLGVDFIMIPTAGYKSHDSMEIHKEIKNRDVIFLVEDESAYQCMKAFATEIEGQVSHIYFRTLDSTKDKFDLSDYVNSCKNKKEVINDLKNY